MRNVRAMLNGRWVRSTASGLLIIASLIVGAMVGGPVADGLMIGAAVVAGSPIVVSAARALLVKVVGIDLLVSVAAIGAVIVGNYWEAAAVTFLFAIGHALESATLNRTRSALAELVAVAPVVAIALREGVQVEVPAASVAAGETVLVKNGAQVPVDGVVIDGTGAIDEATITGESIPVGKDVGDTVYAGTVSAGGFIQVRATGVGSDTTLARIIHRVEEAQDAKAKTQAFMDRFSAWYTPGIIVLAVLVGIVTGDVVLALTLLVIGCPGALVISIPVSIVAGIGRGAKDGVLVKGGEYLETSARISAVALDKTGTLTEGRPRLTDVVALDPNLQRAELLYLAARAEAGSEHPLARPIIEAAVAENLGPIGVPHEVVPVVGKGITAVVDGRRVVIGNLSLLADEDIDEIERAALTADQLGRAGKTPMLVAVDGRIAGVIAVADRIREDAAQMVAGLHDAGVSRVIMLTGDQPAVASAVADAVGVDSVRAGLLPEDKVDAVAQLKADGHIVAMVGDGVNDAPALATADIGVAMGAAGSAVAIETADIALMGDSLRKLPEAISLARRTVRTMRQNIVIALLTVVLLLAGVLFGGVTMAIGMLVHEASVLVVIGNAMRLLRRERRAAESSTTAAFLSQAVN